MDMIDRLQEPQVLRLAMGELNAAELRIAQAAVRFALFHLSQSLATVRPLGREDDVRVPHPAIEYAQGWNDCREAALRACSRLSP